MGLFDFIRSKKAPKCAECLGKIEGTVKKLNGKTYCENCYGKKRESLSYFECSVCKKKLSIRFRHAPGLCIRCASARTATEHGEPPTDALNEFETLKKKCHALCHVKGEEEAAKTAKAELWEMLLRLDAIWVAIDEDYPAELPFIGLTGPMEIFSREEYALAAKEYFAQNNEGLFGIKKIEKKDIRHWLEWTMFLGATTFNLDNGSFFVNFTMEDYMPYEAGKDISRQNRAMRCGLFRSVQADRRYHRIKHENEAFVKFLLSVLYSNGYTALANGTVFALTAGPYVENAKFVSQRVYEKHEEQYLQKTGTGEHGYLITLENDTQLPTLLKNEELHTMRKSGSYTVFSVKKVGALQTILFPNQTRWIPIFTDEAEAEKMRQKFESFGAEHTCNVIAVEFEEIISPLLTCHGAVVDNTLYSHFVSREVLLQIQSKMNDAKQKKEGNENV